ncbi:MAG: hypothetical protein C4584_01560 [Armatimonadetes bacterium]|nr:MAG: hypothetical protein C4584_01560 [Armatimonadota bacterium]
MIRLPAERFKKLSLNHIFLGIVFLSVALGTITGYFLSQGDAISATSDTNTSNGKQAAKNPEQDTRTFRDFAEGTLKARPISKNLGEYVEGTHILVREGAVPVALTSSVVDLSQYENKDVKVFGETQKAIKEGWLMDVGKVEEK